MSTASSCSSSCANDDNDFENGPVVNWPEYLTKMMPGSDLVSLKSGAIFRKDFSGCGDVILSSSTSAASLDSYCGSNNNTNMTTTTSGWNPQQQMQQQQVVVVKRVTFWDMPKQAMAAAAVASF